MCECGCRASGRVYRLPIDKQASYTIELYPGCKNCVGAPGIFIRKHVKTSAFWDEISEAPEFPLAKVDGFEEGDIKCGLDPDEFRKAGASQLTGLKVDGAVIDDIFAEIIAEDLWGALLSGSPEVVAYQERAS